ncbi:cation:proton antiporter [Microlunatus soli]|uniref:Sodium/proton antiporter, CPA1 family n=1 Tax=Microlunatus soli TaxID=630515 RepID=A0A1H1NJX1_9ACTN|nr:sodium:proton antiporter [Microlunatus soli]SDR99351.1 sodium/proton antiporter, CPA1 family [Microlunatus soli]
MNGVELLLVVIAAIAVSAISQRKGLQAPLILVLLGLAVSFIPGLPRLEIEPELILSLVLPPLLYSTALEFSFVNFVRNLWPIIGLGVILVIVTALAAGFTAYWLVPSVTVGAGLVLGSVVAPSDAVTAEAIGRRLGLPKRVMTILTGESLINDAAALTMFTITTVAVTGAPEFISSPVLFFGYGVVVGVVVGAVLANVVRLIQRRLKDPGLETVLGLVVPFAAYLAAEELHASGVIAVVTAGFVIGHNSGKAGYAARIQERQVWHSLDVLLEAFVFAYMGMQMRFVFAEVIEAGYSLPAVLVAAFIVLLVVMAVRPAYVLINHARLVGLRAFYRRQRDRHPERFDAVRQRRYERRAQQLKRREEERRRRGLPDRGHHGPDPSAVRREGPLLPLKHDLVISWTGMRGVVTLAAAAGIPMVVANGQPFPGRPVIQAIAFVVAVGTLLIQGFSLPPLIRKLNLGSEDDERFEAEQRRRANEVTQNAAAKVMTNAIDRVGDRVDPAALKIFTAQMQRFQQNRQELQQHAEESERPETEDGRAALGEVFGELRMEMLDAQRRALTAERDAWRLDDDTYREMLEQLDYDAAATSARLSSRL